MEMNAMTQAALSGKWAQFPTTYREEQIAQLLHWVALGESGVVVGASGTGKSNIAGYIANRPDVICRLLPEEPAHYCFLHFDMNSLPSVTTTNFYRGLLYTLQDTAEQTPALGEPLSQLMNRLPTNDDQLAFHFTLQKAHEIIIRGAGKQVVWLIDRFDEACKHLEPGVLNSLRNLRDRFKDQLSYMVFSRFPLGRLRNSTEFDEFHEIMAPHTCWVGAMNTQDARWVVQQVSERYRRPLAETDIQQMFEMTGCWPSSIKIGCSALASGELVAGDSPTTWQKYLLTFTSFQSNYQEIWDDCSLAEQAVLAAIAWCFEATDLDPAMLLYLQQLGLLQKNSEGNIQIFAPLFEAFIKQQWRFNGPISLHKGIVMFGSKPLPVDLTLLELRLLDYLIAHASANCEKNDLIAAVWPDEKQVKGIRDESLSQLVKRLRRKIEPADKTWTYIETIYGRGYRFNQPSV